MLPADTKENMLFNLYKLPDDVNQLIYVSCVNG